MAKPLKMSIKISSDDRGVFVPFLNGIDVFTGESSLVIKRVYYVYNCGRGIIRGFHFHQYEWKYFCIACGAAKFVAVNPLHAEERFVFVSSERKPDLVVIPPGYANGWMSLEEKTVLVCGSTATLEESLNDDQRFDPYTWGDVWTVKSR